MSYNSDIKNRAKQLYLEVDTRGRRKHTLPRIKEYLEREFNVKIHRSSLHYWKKQDNWDDQFIKMKQYGVEKAQEKEDEKLYKKADDIARLYQIMKGLNIQASNKLLNQLENSEDEAAFRDLVQLLKHTSSLMVELQGDNRNNQGIVIKLDQDDTEL